MNDIRTCYLPEIPNDFDTSSLVVEKPHTLSFQTSSGRRKFVGVFIVVCLAVGATMYMNYISKKAADERRD
jgi:hypothetical protein